MSELDRRLVTALIFTIATFLLALPVMAADEAQFELRAGNLLVQDQFYDTDREQTLFHSQTLAATDTEAFGAFLSVDGVAVAQTSSAAAAAQSTGFYDTTTYHYQNNIEPSTSGLITVSIPVTRMNNTFEQMPETFSVNNSRNGDNASRTMPGNVTVWNQSVGNLSRTNLSSANVSIVNMTGANQSREVETGMTMPVCSRQPLWSSLIFPGMVKSNRFGVPLNRTVNLTPVNLTPLNQTLGNITGNETRNNVTMNNKTARNATSARSPAAKTGTSVNGPDFTGTVSLELPVANASRPDRPINFSSLNPSSYNNDDSDDDGGDADDDGKDVNGNNSGEDGDEDGDQGDGNGDNGDGDDVDEGDGDEGDGNGDYDDEGNGNGEDGDEDDDGDYYESPMVRAAEILSVPPLTRQANKPMTPAMMPVLDPGDTDSEEIINTTGWERFMINNVGWSDIDSSYANFTSAPVYINPSKAVEMSNQFYMIAAGLSMTRPGTYLNRSLWCL